MNASSSFIQIDDSQLFQPGATYTFTSPPPLVCFKSGARILCLSRDFQTEIKILIEELQVGDYVRTLKHNYLPVVMIGSRRIHHSPVEERIKDQLYVCSRDKYEGLTDDLVLTGCHSILVDAFGDGEREATENVLGKIFATDGRYRLPACVDARATVYPVRGEFIIYHLALKNKDYGMNYGIDANGLLVETCSLRNLKERSGMTLCIDTKIED